MKTEPFDNLTKMLCLKSERVQILVRFRKKFWNQPHKKSSPGWVGRRTDGWMDGWMDVKASSRIAHSNQKSKFVNFKKWTKSQNKVGVGSEVM